ncbi:uncharacterized protein LOC113325192 [Papaver somniferum]|uniref:uncharacterized protein LOC113325192 n=1 Tax=Papaver somniferum TaxID=3469 RepID=UPI000E7017A0|nr:uncharacterized protein LOC113325192 [Papaver somniferum]
MVVHNSCQGNKGNIWLFWNKCIAQPQVISVSSQMIIVSVGDALISGVHAHIKVVQKRFLWYEMHLISDLNRPWIILGDFNAVISQDEKVGGRLPNRTRMLDFNECINQCELLPAPKNGLQFSWSNCQHGNKRILYNLDIVLFNQKWLHLYGDWGYKVGMRIVSDHAPLLGGCAKEKVKAATIHSDNNPFDETSLNDLVQAQNEYASREVQQKTLLKQKSRVKWIKEGAANTIFFHTNMKIRTAKNTINELEDDDGNVLVDQDAIAQHLINHFQKKFEYTPVEEADELLDVIPTVINEDDQTMLDVISEEAEIKKIIFEMDPESALSPDGFSANQFRPISLSNVIFKIFTKIITRRMSDLMKKLISPQQVAYVKGRSIHEKVLLAYELVNEMKFKRRGGNVSIKLDISQAYDTGDPLSPILFVLMEDMLSRNISSLVEKGNLQAMVSKKGIHPTHLFFADDVFIFSNGGRKSLANLLKLLDTYQACSGQVINKLKNKYLGVYLAPGNITSAMIWSIVEKIQKKLDAWKGRLLSFQDKEEWAQFFAAKFKTEMGSGQGIGNNPQFGKD